VEETNGQEDGVLDKSSRELSYPWCNLWPGSSIAMPPGVFCSTECICAFPLLARGSCVEEKRADRVQFDSGPVVFSLEE